MITGTMIDVVFLILGWLFPSPLKWLSNRYKSRDPVAYDHYKLRAMKRGHDAKTPLECGDGECANLK